MTYNNSPVTYSSSDPYAEPIKVSVDNPLPVQVLSGGGGGGGGDASAANQVTGNASLASIDTKVATQTTLAALLAKVLAAPATEAKQDTAITSLAAIDTDIGAPTATAAAADGTGDYSIIAGIKRGLLNWTSMLARTPAALGQGTMAQSFPVVLASNQSAINTVEATTFITGVAAQTAIVNNILDTAASANALDIPNFRAVSVQVVSTGTAGTFIFEQSNDNVNFRPVVVYNSELGTAVPIAAAITATASSILYTFAVRARYLRLRIVTTITGGTIQAFSRLSTEPWTPSVASIAQATAANLAMTATQALGTAATRYFAQISDGTNSPSIKAASTPAVIADLGIVVNPTPNQLGPILVNDVVSAALTTTTTTAALTPTGGSSYQINIPVTAVTGTTPTLDFGIEESDDSGTNWGRIYDFPRITAVGMYRSPKFPNNGNRVRYVQTVGGSTPSFTRAVNRLQTYDTMQPIRQLFDRAIVLTTLNSTTATLFTAGTRNVQLAINIGTATTPPTIQLEGSDDFGVTWYALGTALAAVASSTVQVTVSNVQTTALRGRVSVIGATVVAGYVLIKGF